MRLPDVLISLSGLSIISFCFHFQMLATLMGVMLCGFGLHHYTHNDYNVQHLFMNLFAICIFSLMNVFSNTLPILPILFDVCSIPSES